MELEQVLHEIWGNIPQIQPMGIVLWYNNDNVTQMNPIN